MNKDLQEIYMKMLVEDAKVEAISISNNTYTIVLSKESFWPYDPPGSATEYTYILTPAGV